MPYLPHTAEEIRQMLRTIAKPSVDSLFEHIPQGLRISKPLDLPPPLSESELLREMSSLAAKNACGAGTLSFLGAGAYRHFIPAAVTELSMRSEFLTPYTPYQPEIAQGTLQTAFEYQSLMCRIFDLGASNASLYDGSTALSEAALMALRIGKNRNTIVVCETVHPQYREVLHTLLDGHRAKLITLPAQEGGFDRERLRSHLNDDLAAVIVQFPNFFGIVEDFSELAAELQAKGSLLIASVPEPLSLGILNPPGAWGADIAVGEGLSFGIPMTFGGPGLGIFTTREKYLRQMPGRVCGETVDADGRRSYVLTLSTREQHIRREKATSNICTNQAHCATTATIYLSLLGKEGFRELAAQNAQKTHYARRQLANAGLRDRFGKPTFNEFVVELPCTASSGLEKLRSKGIHGGIDVSESYPGMEKCILICVTELHTAQDIDRLRDELGNL